MSLKIDNSWQDLIDNYVIPNKHISKDLRFCSGTCKICGERLDVVTYNHAEKHGFDNPYKFIHTGNVRYDLQIINDAIEESIDESKDK